MTKYNSAVIPIFVIAKKQPNFLHLFVMHGNCLNKDPILTQKYSGGHQKVIGFSSLLLSLVFE